ncbi:hypothetical protein AYO38_00665 [bacterium SCGC AG-212-C10]|nr:hypothetical protein AYO38_00665 [bacterium SCGC AG-212-C10]
MVSNVRGAVSRWCLRDVAVGIIALVLIVQHGFPLARALAQDEGVTPSANTPLASGFTYQGRLEASAADANGPYDFQFALFDQAVGGIQAGSTITANDLAVTDGLFSIVLDFGASAFTGSERYLDIRVRAGASNGAYEPLGRQRLTATPYALYATTATTATTASSANSVPWSGITGIPAGFADGIDADALAALGSCQAGQVVKWNGNAFACAADNIGAAGTGDITAVIAGSGLTGGADSGDATLGVAFAGDGSANTVARSDHNHLNESWSGNFATGLAITNTAQSGTTLSVNATAPYSTSLAATNTGDCSSAGKVCYGVYGKADAFAGGNGFGGVGVRGDGTNTGVLGIGPQYGVYGQSSSGTGIGAASSQGVGLLASSASSSILDSAIEAESTDDAYGVRVKTVDGVGVSVESENNTGVYGSGSTGLQGYANASGGVGVHGVSNQTNGVGIIGFAGVAGTGTGVRGVGTRVGVWGAVGSSGSLPAGNWAGYFQGNVLATGTFTPSDVRLKHNVEDIPYGLDSILALRPVTFALNSDPANLEHIGVVAQEVEQVLPSIVYRPDGDPDATLSVNYTELIPVLIKAVQQQQEQIRAIAPDNGATAPWANRDEDVSLALVAAIIAVTALVTATATAGALRFASRSRLLPA